MIEDSACSSIERIIIDASTFRSVCREFIKLCSWAFLGITAMVPGLHPRAPTWSQKRAARCP